MNQDLNNRLARAPVVPLVQADDPGVALAIAEALVAGGLSVLEVVLRTEQAIECVARIANDLPEAIVGAGTVLDRNHAAASIDAGARFIVSPGLDEGVVTAAKDAMLPVFPGIATATELQRARNLGLDCVKFFPAELAGGSKMLGAFGAVFRDMRFMPTGGVSPANLADYLALPQVIACGGSWLTPAAAVAEGNYDELQRLAEEALQISAAARRA